MFYMGEHMTAVVEMQKDWLHQLGEMREDQSAFLGQELVLLHSELLQELTPCHREDGLEETAAEHLGGLIPWQAVITLGDMAVTQPPKTQTQETRPFRTEQRIHE